MKLEDFIKEANIIHNNKFDYSKVVNVRNKKEKVIIICPIHGEFKQTQTKHLNAKISCRKCSLEHIAKSRTTTIEQFVERANKKHHNKYDYSLVKFNNLDDNVDIICPSHGVYSIRAIYHLKHGCKKCYSPYLKHKVEDILEKCKLAHNNKYDYSKVEYKGYYDNVEIICPNHGSFMMTMNLHLRYKRGCGKCKKDLFNNDILNKLKEKHPTYDYSLVNKFLLSEKINVICPIHNKFSILLSSHLEGRGCPKCSNDKKKITMQEFLERAKLCHGDKYDYSEVNFDKVGDKIKIRCYNHGYFYQRMAPHIYAAHGCPKCSKIVSKEETEWLNYLKIPKEYRNYKLIIDDCIFFPDGYDPSTNTVYEFYGDYWHGNLKLYPPDKMNKLNKMSMQEMYDRTMLREEKIKLAGYNIVSIWQNDWQKMKREK